MTNHLHLLVRVSDEPVFKTVRHFASQYARRFNRKYQSVGRVFQGRHQRRHVATDTYLKQVTRYIHRNPLEAGLVEEPLERNWSSYRAYIGLVQCQFLTETVLDILPITFVKRLKANNRYYGIVASHLLSGTHT